MIIIIEAGSTLKSVREKSGISLDEVSNDLNISVLDLMQIEEGSIGSFDNIYELKQMISDYAKYLGVDVEAIMNHFNEYMFEYTSKIPMDEIEKSLKKNNEEENGISSPYTKIVPKEKTLPYIITGVIIFILVLIALLWSIKQIKDNRASDGDIIGINWIGE